MQFFKNALVGAMILCSIFFQKNRCSQEKRQLTLPESMCVSLATGASEALTGRPLDFLKATKIVNEPRPSNPLRWYAGLPMHLLGIVPTTLMQGQMKSLLTRYGNCDATQSAALAGMSSTVIACPVERLILEQQTTKQSLLKILAEFQTKGVGNLYKGAPALAYRELLFTLGYMNFFHEIEFSLKKHVSHEYAQATLAALAGGIPLALISHPFESIRTWQQKGRGKTMADAFHNMKYNEKGEWTLGQNLFAGGMYRTIRYCLALGVMAKVHENMTNYFQNR